jgi:hypothetical protein
MDAGESPAPAPPGEPTSPAPPRKRAKPLWRRILRVVLIVLAVPLVLVVVLVAALHTGPGRAFVRGKIEARLASRVEGTVELGQLDYSLFGAITIGGLRIRDASGAEVIALESLTIAPDWRSLLGDEPALDSVALQGLTVHVRREADGTTNLSKLFKPTPPSPASGARRPDRRIQVRAITIAAVNATLDRPDGARLTLSNLEIAASLDAIPGARTVRLEVPRISGGFSFERSADGLTIAVSGFQSGVDVALVRGAGTLGLARTTAHASLVMGGAAPRETDLDLERIDLTVAEGELDATVGRLLAGALVLGSIEVRGKGADGALAGDQKAQALGLHLDADRFNALLGKQLIATDIDVETRLSGPPARLVLASAVETRGGKLTLDGTVDVSDLAHPGYDLTLVASDFGSERLLRPEAATIPKIEGKEIRLVVKGRGITREKAAADISLRIGPTTLGKLVLDEATLDARLERGELVIHKLEIHTFGQKLALGGRFDPASKYVKAELTVDGDVGVAVERLRRAGIPVRAAVPAGTGRLREGDLVLSVEGELEGVLQVGVKTKRIAFAGGSVAIDAGAALLRKAPGQAGPAFEPGEVAGVVTLEGVDLEALAAMRGVALPGFGGTLGGRVAMGGTAADPRVDYALAVRARSKSVLGGFFSPTLAVDLRGKADKRHLDAELDVERLGSPALTLITASMHAPLLLEGARRGLAPDGPLRIALDVPRRPLTDFIALLPKPIAVALSGFEGEIAAHADVSGTPGRPAGAFDIDVAAGLLAGAVQRLHLQGKLAPPEGGGKKAVLTADASVWLDRRRDTTLTVDARAELSGPPLASGQRGVDWVATIDLPPLSLSELPVPADKLEGLEGTALAHADLHGTTRDLFGEATITLRDASRGARGPGGARLAITIGPKETAVDLGVAYKEAEALRVSGTIGAAGTGLIPAIREKQLGNAPLNLAMTIPRREVAELLRPRTRPAGIVSTIANALLRPWWEYLPGSVSGGAAIGGTVGTPTLEGALVYDGFTTIDHGPGRAALAVNATPETITASIALGSPSGGSGPGPGGGQPPGAAPVVIDASLPRAAIAGYRTGGLLPIAVRARAGDVDIRTLAPAFVLDGKGFEVGGRLRWTMDGAVALTSTPAGPAVAEGVMDGSLAIEKGRMTLPHSRRVYEDIELRLASDAAALRIESLALRESDLEKPRRTLGASGRLAWTNLRPDRLTFDLKAADWLIFGTDKLGPADAPRGAVTLDIGVSASLGGPVKVVDADVRSLELLVPERFARAHQPEAVSLGDVIYLDEVGGAPGKLPVSAKGAPAKPGAALESRAATADPDSNPEASAATGFDIHVRVPRRAHLLQAPLNLWVQGEVNASIRPGKKKIEGRLAAVDGDLTLAGKRHRLDHGAIVFDEANPTGLLDLHFVRDLPPATLRDISLVSAGGGSVRVDMVGAIGKPPKVTLSGAGNASLFDVLAVHNAGRTRYYAEPDMPAGATAQIPQYSDLLVLTYMGINLPHLLFLDRLNAWADPYDDRTSYGRIQHLEAETYVGGGDFRIRAVTRPPAAGQSEAELHYDWLLTKPGGMGPDVHGAASPQEPGTAGQSPPRPTGPVFGLGLRAGSRLGGGPGIFFEWSSHD